MTVENVSEEVKQMCLTLNTLLAPIVPHLNCVLHYCSLAFHFFIYNCSQVQVVCALRSLMHGSSNV
jgi:hypothetical protein